MPLVQTEIRHCQLLTLFKRLMHHLQGEKQQPLQTAAALTLPHLTLPEREMEGGGRPPSLVDSSDSAIKKIWLPWPLAAAHNHPKHQRAVALHRLHEREGVKWWRGSKVRKLGWGKATERGRSKGSRGGEGVGGGGVKYRVHFYEPVPLQFLGRLAT